VEVVTVIHDTVGGPFRGEAATFYVG